MPALVLLMRLPYHRHKINNMPSLLWWECEAVLSVSYSWRTDWEHSADVMIKHLNSVSRLRLVLLFSFWVSWSTWLLLFMFPCLKKWATTSLLHGIVGGHLEHSKGSVNSCYSRHHLSAWVSCAGVWLTGGFASPADLMALAAQLAPARGW